MGEAGRPLIKIDWDEFDKLCSIQCTLREIAAWFKCHTETIESAVKREKGCDFSTYWTEKSAPGKISLRRKQWELALKGDKTMLIWLGKQYLDQAEKVDQRMQNTLLVEQAMEFAGLPKEELLKIAHHELKKLKEGGDKE